MSPWRFAAAIAFSRDPRHRWRQVSVAGAAAIAIIAALLAVALTNASIAAYERGAARAPEWSPELNDGNDNGIPGDAALAIVERGSLVDGEQVATVWLQPVNGHENDPSVVPAGLSRLPSPGEAVLSPALLRAGHSADDFGWTSSTAGAGGNGSIGPSGLMAESERLIYVRPVAGRDITVGAHPTYTSGFHDGAARGIAFSVNPEVLPPSLFALDASLFLVIPSIVLLVSSVRARSGLREKRLSMMVTFGVRASTARLILAVETAMLVGVGTVVGLVAFIPLRPLLRHIPGTDLHLSAQGFDIPWFGGLLAVVVLVVIGGCCGALGRLEPVGHRYTTRRVGYVRPLILAASILCLVLSFTSQNPLAFFLSDRVAQSALLVVGIFGSILSVPLAIPDLTSALSAVMELVRRPVLWAGARRLRHDAIRLSRVASTLSVLIMVLGTSVALWGASTAEQSSVGRAEAALPVASRLVSWADSAPEDIASAQQDLSAAGLDALILPVVTADEEMSPPQLRTEDCKPYAEYIGEDPAQLCAGDRDAAFAASVSQTLGFGITDSNSSGSTSAEDSPVSAVIISAQDAPVLDIQRALGNLPALNLTARYADVTAPLPVAQWVIGFAVYAFVLLTAAVLREIGDRSLDDADRDQHYLRLGLSTATANRLAWIVLLVPVAIGTCVAFAVSILIAAKGDVAGLMVNDPLRLFLVAASALVLACAVVLIAAPARRALRGERSRRS